MLLRLARVAPPPPLPPLLPSFSPSSLSYGVPPAKDTPTPLWFRRGGRPGEQRERIEEQLGERGRLGWKGRADTDDGASTFPTLRFPICVNGEAALRLHNYPVVSELNEWQPVQYEHSLSLPIPPSMYGVFLNATHEHVPSSYYSIS